MSILIRRLKSAGNGRRRVPSVEEIVTVLKKMLTKIDRRKLWVNPDCGLKTRGVPETQASLKNMVEAARILRETV